MKQIEAFKILQAGHNVLLTGPAGSGKTYLLNRFISHLKKKKIGVAITASTGIAATHIGGRTIHSWAGIGIKDKLGARELKSLTKKSYLKKQLERTEVLIIDEISMLHAHRLDMVDMVCRAFKKNSLPFGGIQLIMSGDFFQLPPITPSSDESEFVFKAGIWHDMDLRVCYLDEQHRQNDKNILHILGCLRQNDINPEIKKMLAERLNRNPEPGINPVRLYTHNADVDFINDRELEKIDSPEYRFGMRGEGETKLVESLKKNCLAPQELILKKGALVMFVKNKFKNENAVYINGTTGKVVKFGKDNYPVVRLNSGKEILAEPDSWTIDDDRSVLAKITQIPLRLAWAITVHKSQGMTLDAAEIDLSRSFGYGMGYVALSRLTSLEGLFLMGINDMAYRLDPAIFAYDKELIAFSEEAKKNKPKSYKIQDSLIP